MKIWYTIRREAAAAWRSLRYDLRGLAGGHPSPAGGRPGTGNGGEPTADLSRAGVVVEPYPDRDHTGRRPSRLRPAVGAAVLAVLLAGVTYLGVLQGLSALLVDETLPVSGLPAAEGDGRIGRAPAPASPDPAPPAVPVPPAPTSHPPAPPSPTPTGSGPTSPPESTRTPTPDPSCPCPSPSSPTPPTPTPSVSPTPTVTDPTGSPTGTPSGVPPRAADPGRASAS